MNANSKSVETSRAIIEAVTAKTGYAKSIGIEVGAISPGRVEMFLTRREELTQADGYFHGGVISGLADHATGAAIVSALPDHRFCLTVGLTISYLAPASGERLRVVAEAVRASSSIGIATASIYSETKDGESVLCALATGTMRAIDMAQTKAPKST